MNIDQLTVNTIRFLSADAIQNANSGHPGLPLGAAPTAYTLWAKSMKHNPKNADWANRDRFVLSAGHGSALLYSMLHLFDYGLPIEELKRFRQMGSKTPGHPEYKHTPGVETTTGPLGQGIANAVGFAWAEAYLAAQFNKPGFDIVDHYTYALCGEGCLMEGVSAEASSLAGTLGLGKLILLFDSNQITIEGDTAIAFTEDVRKRYESYGWQTILVEDGTDMDKILQAIEEAKKETNKPTLIEIKTKIGFGAPNKQGKASAHGEPLGVDEIALAKKALGFDYTEDFVVPDEVSAHMKQLVATLGEEEGRWNELFAEYAKQFPEMAEKWHIWHSKELPVDLLNDPDYWNYEGDLATRVSSEKVLNKLAGCVPNLIGGSADLAPSTKTIMKDRGHFTKDTKDGSNLHFGIREFAMTAIANGMAAHGGLIPYISGFFVFSDYMKSGLRMQALMGLPVISILTHDSIGVGEDGPTHQPVEHLAALRSIPDYTVYRPCDTNETAAAWYYALQNQGPTALVLTRQNLPLLKESGKEALKGAYILKDCEGTPDIVLMASGSEVSLIYDAYDILKEKGIKARVISMPSWEVFEAQPASYKEALIPNKVRCRLAVEAGADFGWHKYVGLDGDVVSINTFGASAPAGELFKKLNFTVEHVVERAQALLNR